MRDEKGSRPPPNAAARGSFATAAPHAIDGRILCIGGAVLDTTLLAAGPVINGTSNPASGSRAFGGVARNVAENLVRLGVATAFLSRVGEDENGRLLKGHLAALGVDVRGVDAVSGARTAEYIALLEPDRSLAVGIADMDIFERLDASLLNGDAGLEARWIFADCNCRPDLLRALIARSPPHAARLAVDTVSVAKAARLPAALHGIDLLFLNLDEAAAVLRCPRPGLDAPDAVSRLLARGADAVVLTLGAAGLLVGQSSGEIAPILPIPAEVADVTGAGDALVAATLAAMAAGLALVEAARWGCLAATLTIERIGGTRPDLSVRLLRERAQRLVRDPP